MTRINGLPALVERLQLDHLHAVALLWNQGGYAFAVLDCASGEVLAWDGWYYELDEPSHASQDVRELAWAEWDDMPGKLLHTANAPALGAELGYWLMPTYSVAHEAGALVRTHRTSATDAATATRLREARLCAYLPIVDEPTFQAAAGAG